MKKLIIIFYLVLTLLNFSHANIYQQKFHFNNNFFSEINPTDKIYSSNFYLTNTKIRNYNVDFSNFSNIDNRKFFFFFDISKSDFFSKYLTKSTDFANDFSNDFSKWNNFSKTIDDFYLKNSFDSKLYNYVNFEIKSVYKLKGNVYFHLNTYFTIDRDLNNINDFNFNKNLNTNFKVYIKF